jgi:hypothetical protein
MAIRPDCTEENSELVDLIADCSHDELERALDWLEDQKRRAESAASTIRRLRPDLAPIALH